MSRIGKKPVPFPKTVKVAINGNTISFEGPKGKSRSIIRGLRQRSTRATVVVERIDDEKLSRAIHGSDPKCWSPITSRVFPKVTT